jgi:hypothetical protein
VSSIIRHLVNRIKAIPREVEQTAVAKIGQGSTELSNALFSQSPAYSPVTADKAADNAHRAQFQNKDQSRGMER